MTWPVYLDHIRAKSEARGGQTLTQHTWDVLQRLTDLYRIHKGISDDVWRWLYFGTLLHDFGKAASGFQRMLAGERHHLWVEGRHRHEVLSLAFADWFFPNGPDRPWVLSVIAFHHKDMSNITYKYGGTKPGRDMDAHEKEGIQLLSEQIDRETQQLLWQWLDEYAQVWAEAFPIGKYPSLLPQSEAVASSKQQTQRIFNSLRDLHIWRETLSNEERLTAVLCRGLILTADRTASAGLSSLPMLDLDSFRAMRPLSGYTLRPHQQAAREVEARHVILVAPTSSGKTEAAILWAARQNASRLFYVLPYQTSMNAMQDRLAQKYYDIETPDRNDTVMVQHSRAALKLYRDHMDADGGANASAAARVAKAKSNRADLNAYPIKVFSPYQMLKAAYQLRAYESMIVDFTGAVFVFDEIHAYEPKRLALIIEMMRWLADKLGAHFFIMTATLPPLVHEQLTAALSEVQVIQMTELYHDFQRHTLHIVEGGLSDYLDEIVGRWEHGESVLVCCNTVAHAQEMYNALSDKMNLPPDADELMLLHSRFNIQDRRGRERKLLERVGTRHRVGQTIFVATQIIEVSLDIDFDTLYTEAAPLDALLQRFGRVNRGRVEKVLCPVHVMRDIVDEGKPYAQHYVERSLAVLEAHNSQPIDEGMVESWLGKMFTPEMSTEWRAEYERSAREFRDYILGEIQPYESDRATEEQFYQMFDGTQILPECCIDKYDDLTEQGRYLEANELLVNISWTAFHVFKSREYLRLHNEDKNLYCALDAYMPYTSERGLQYPERDTDR